MRGGCWAAILGTSLWMALAAVLLAAEPATAPAEPGDKLFQPHKLWTIQLHLSAKGWEMMQPTRTSLLATVLGVRRADLPTTQPINSPANPAGRRIEEEEEGYVEGARLAACPFGYEYAYARATFSLDGQTINDVGLRFKGNGSYASSAGWIRRPMKLDFGRFTLGGKLHGIRTINLHNGAVDPSLVREPLSYAVYREAGVPAPRTSFALVYLTVDGLMEQQYLGLYSLIEEVDKGFLKRHFATNKGLLLKPENLRNLPYLGEDWDEYCRYNEKGGDPALRERFIDFVRMLHYADDETFVGAIESFMDVDGFLKFLAVTTLESNMDSILTAVHNYYIYITPEDQVLHFLPWDMHLSLGGGAGGPPYERAMLLSVMQPFMVPNRLIERLLMVDSYRQAYEQYIRQFANGCFGSQTMLAHIQAMETIARQADEAGQRPVRLASGATRPSTMPARPVRPMPDLKTFVTARVASVLAQLDGQQMGFVPGERPPGPPPPLPLPPIFVIPKPPPPPKPLPATRPAAMRKALARLEAQRQVALAAKRSPTTAPVALALATTKPTTRPAVAVAAAPVKPAPIAAPVPAPKPMAAPAPPFNLAREARRLLTPVRRGEGTLAGMIARSIDQDRDGYLTQQELFDAIRVFYYAMDKDHAGALDAQVIADGLERMAEQIDRNWLAPLPGATSKPQAKNQLSLTWAKAILTLADTDHDGKLTLSEAIAAAQKFFRDADQNHNGLLNTLELGDEMDKIVPRVQP